MYMSDKFDVKINPAPTHHQSHGQGDAVRGHAVKGNIARDGKAKRVTAVAIHGGMVKHTADGNFRAFGGHDASYLDSLIGATVGGDVKSAPGWGNGSVRTGNPTAIAPAGKRLRPVAVHPNMTKGRGSRSDVRRPWRVDP